MRSRRSAALLAFAALLVIGGPVTATRAGANLETSRFVRRSTVANPAMRKPARKSAPRKIVVREAAARKVAATTAVPKVVPTMCESVVASVSWPTSWHTRCAGPRDAVLGLTNPQSRTTTVYVRAGESLATMHVVVLHEAGHAWDIARLDSAKIVEWCAARGCDPARFFSGGQGGAGWGQPGGAEDWAAAWDACHGGDYHRSYIGLGAPTQTDCALQNALVNYAGAIA